ncbi:Hypothetical predicted protein [Paramuricea clavata]|uniref:Transcription factor AP-2 C-terminal domain-containing protein n=1 Tax=Paramuricea clavata TaxID=317549 RepID=A0A7D9DEQ5_PARCT|nr:Hypothetical predicted protein [Paramuricea clavata]
MSETRSLGIQCQSRKSTAVQTKRLSKEELRYYTKIVDKEKEVLLNFIKATKEYPALRQPHYRINLTPTQTKLRKNVGTRKKRKSKKHASHKTKGKTNEDGDQENTSHYVSKIVVDDATHCLKLRVRSCKKSQELKENNSSVPPERTRSRKAKQPRRYTRSLESLTENINGDGMDNPKVESSHQLVKEKQESPNVKPERATNDENNNVSPASPTTLSTKSVKAEVENTDCLFANSKLHLSSPDSSPLPTMTSQLAPILSLSDEESPNGQATSPNDQTTSPDGQATSDDDSNYNSPNDDSDDNQSVCSEEFFIVETNEHNVDDGKEGSSMNSVSETADKTKPTKKSNIEETNTNLKDELKKRLKANLIRKASDNEQYENATESLSRNGSNTCRNMEEPKVLPQVVSVHFYDPQTHSQRVVGADTHIPYLSNPMIRDASMTLSYPKPPSITLPYPKSPAATLSYPPHLSRAQKPTSPTLTPPRSPNLSQATLPRIPPMKYPYPSYYPNATDIHKQHSAYQLPSVPASTKVRALPPEISSNSITSRGNVSCYGNMPTQVSLHHPETITNSITTRDVASRNATISRSLPPETRSYGVTAREDSTSTTNAPTEVIPHHPELASNTIPTRGVTPTSADNPIEITEIDKQGKKRKRFIFGAHEPPKKKVISSLLTPLCEREATRLADGIHEINMQYFPLRSLAQKAAKRVSGDTDDVLKLIDQKIQLKTKIQDVEKARNLLKDIYDMVLKSKEIEDIQNFELVSHNFGVRNILNHLSLVDLYFGELGTELESKI